jgi:DNA-binding Lrp family transcriptional regulator
MKHRSQAMGGMHPVRLNDIDLRILAQLQEDAGRSTAGVAQRVGLSHAGCARRIQMLEKAGVIKRYAAIIDANAAELPVTVFVHIRFDWRAKERIDLFERTIMDQPEVLECYLVTGEADYLLRVVVRDVETYERFLVERLRRLPGLARLKSGFVIREVKHATVTANIESTQPMRRRPMRRPKGR